jgi:hypothetical protein
MTHMQLARWVRQHGTGIELFLVASGLVFRVFDRFVGVGGDPVLLRGLFYFCWAVFILHDG